VDTEGLVLKAKIHRAKVPDQDGLALVLKAPVSVFHASLIYGWTSATRAEAESGQSRSSA
jgi:hypothetical protein